MALAPGGRAFLRERIGEGLPRKAVSMEEALEDIPESRLPDHPLVTTDKRERLIYAQGQSLPDWVVLRQGHILRSADLSTLSRICRGA